MTDSTRNTAPHDIHPLPLHLLGLKWIPGVPLHVDGMIDTLVRLGEREQQMAQALQGLNRPYTLDGQTQTAHTFLFGATHRAERKQAREELLARLKTDARALAETFLEELLGRSRPSPLAGPTALSLERPEQFSMTWTTQPDVWSAAAPQLATFAACLEDPQVASRELWPTIARSGLPFNLLFLKKVEAADLSLLEEKLGSGLTSELQATAGDGRLYLIDLTVFESVEPQQVDGFTRFTPATLTLLEQDAASKTLEPVAIRVSGHDGADAQLYDRRTASGSVWIYACQAARTSVTVYGIWLGHVYQWHLVTAAMQMTLCDNVPGDHPLSRLLAPMSKYLMPLDDVFLALWPHLTPPTSIASSRLFLHLANTFAEGRSFFDDDPPEKLRSLGLSEEDFSADQPWDRYLLVRQLLEIWQAVDDYVETFVEHTYADDQQVAGDPALQAWMAAAEDPKKGNLRGLPEVTSKTSLARVLCSLIFRIVVHGCTRLVTVANPYLTFCGNYPPCLQRDDIPAPDAELDTATLLTYMPKTGTLGGMVDFYFTFSFSPPYEPFVPIDGIDADLSFDGGLDDPRNAAMVQLREAILAFMERNQPEPVQRFQWPLNVET